MLQLSHRARTCRDSPLTEVAWTLEYSHCQGKGSVLLLLVLIVEVEEEREMELVALDHVAVLAEGCLLISFDSGHTSASLRDHSGSHVRSALLETWIRRLPPCLGCDLDDTVGLESINQPASALNFVESHTQ